MKRRDFLRNAAAASLLPVLIDGYGARAMSRSSAFMRALAGLTTSTDRVLVLIQLNGGNDGLNTVVPLDQMSRYTSLRSNIALPEAKVLKLQNNLTSGLHPAMTGLQQLWNEGKVALVHGVSYPSPNFSHFRSSDIWFTGADSNKTLTSGWMGRYLDKRFPNYPDAYPNAQMPDPLAIQIGAVTSTTLLGPNRSMAIALQNPDTFAQLVGDKASAVADPLPNTSAGRNVAFIRQQQLSSVEYAGQIKVAAGKGKNQVTYPTGNALADQLKIVARLIHGGLQTKVYYVSIGGFDTHANQATGADTTVGTHATLLKNLSDAIKIFQDDLKAMKLEDRVAGMTFSEFGRRAVSNNSLGTDHGAAAPLFVFGSGIKTQIIGKNPDLNDLDNNNIKMQHDFRQVYATLLTDWMGEGQGMATDVLSREFQTVPIFRQMVTATGSLAEGLRVYPNPASDRVVLEADQLEGVRNVQVVDASGRSQRLPVSRLSDSSLNLDVAHLPDGIYFVQVETARNRLSGKVLVAH